MLARCLEGLTKQERAADEVIVVRRHDDLQTASVVASSPVRVVEVLVHCPGVVAALQAGVDVASGDVVALTDDDAVPRPDWLRRLLPHYARADVGGVGGRDVIPADGCGPVPSSTVGHVGAWGRTTAGHHRGAGPAVEVDLLKGVNMSFRRSVFALPDGLRGQGAQVHNELCSSLWARSQGWQLVYDPAGPRFDPDIRGRRPARAVRDEAYNLVLGLTSLRHGLWLRRALYGLLVGDRATPGVARAVLALLRRDRAIATMIAPSLLGQMEALVAVRRGRPAVMRAPRPHR